MKKRKDYPCAECNGRNRVSHLWAPCYQCCVEQANETQKKKEWPQERAEILKLLAEIRKLI